MCDQWMPVLEIPLSLDQFHQLPRNAAFKYEYGDGMARLSPNAKAYHAALDLHTFAPTPAELPPDPIVLRRVRRRDMNALTTLFVASFGPIQPFGSLDEDTVRRAAVDCLCKTTSGEDGPWVRVASYVALKDDQPIGANLVTLMPEVDPTDWDAFYWQQPAPPGMLKQRRGRPHLTWIFVSPWCNGVGVGTALLSASAKVLGKLGYDTLLSTFFSSNDSSMLWHWRNGFKLLPYPGSKRLARPWNALPSGP